MTLDPLIEDCLLRIVDIFLSAGAKSLEELAIGDAENNQGRLAATMRFPGGFRLSVHAQVGIRDGRPDLRKYSMHFMDSGDATIFRYDNSPHFRGAGDSLHHKHEGETAFTCPRPTVRQIRNEIAEYISANP